MINKTLKKTIQKRTALSKTVRQRVGKGGKCANRPDKPAVGCKGYVCPMWLLYGGYFDESGHQVDHIIEVAHGGTNDDANLQALCVSCHVVKTRRCAKQKWTFDSSEIDQGKAHMEWSK